MPVVSIDLRQLSGTSPGVAPLINRNAEAWFTPYRPYHVEADSDDYEVSSDTLKVPLVAGIAAPVMPQTPTGQGVWVQIRNARGLGRADRWLVAIPAGDVNLFDLPHLDPTTLDPEAPLDPAWVAALEAAVPAAGTTGYVLTKGAGGPNTWSAGGGGGGAVASVNTKTGAVVINPDDLDDSATAHKFVTAAEKTKLGNTSGTNTGDQDLSGLVPKTTTVNGHALSGNVVVSASDITTGVLNAAQLPSLALTSVTVVASQAAMLALSVEQGDVAIRTDFTPNKAFILASNSPSTLADWKDITATDLVQSVAGLSGAISASALATALDTALTAKYLRGDTPPLVAGSKVGLKYDGTDETTALNAAIALLTTYGFGGLKLEGLVRADGQVVIPTFLGTATQVRQAPLRITSDGAQNMPGSTFSGDAPFPTAAGLDLRYKGRTDTGCTTTLGSEIVGNAAAVDADRGLIVSGTGVADWSWVIAVNHGVGWTLNRAARATSGSVSLTSFGGRIQSLGFGTLEIDHLQLTCKGSTASSAPMGLSTGTKTEIHDNVFIGHSFKVGATCDEDPWIWGGPGQGTNLTTAVTSGATVTSLAVKALPIGINSATEIRLGAGLNAVTVTTTGAVAKGATTIPVTSFVAPATYPLRSVVMIAGAQEGADAACCDVPSAPFQGYASHFKGNQMYRMRRTAQGCWASSIQVDDNAWMHDCGSNLALTPSTLTTGLTKAATVTTLAVSALNFPVLIGDIIQVGVWTTSGVASQEFVASAAASLGATSITVTSATANATYATGVVVFNSTAGTGAMHHSFAAPGNVNQVNVTNNRMGWSGGYSYATKFTGSTQACSIFGNDFQDVDASGKAIAGHRFDREAQYNMVIPGLVGSSIPSTDDWSSSQGASLQGQTVIDSGQSRATSFPQGLRLGTSLTVNDPTVAGFNIFSSDGTGLVGIAGAGRTWLFDGPLTVRGNSTSGSTLTIGDPTVALPAVLVLNATSGQSTQIQFVRGGTNSWLLYDGNSDGCLFLRDNPNSKMMMSFFGGAGTGGGTIEINSAVRIQGDVGFYNTVAQPKPTITGSRGGNSALASLLTQLATLGLVTDSSS